MQLVVIVVQPLHSTTATLLNAEFDPCTVCHCDSFVSEPSYHQLDCTHRNLSALHTEYPALQTSIENGLLPGIFINIIFDDNPVRRLGPFPATHNAVAFSCRRCALTVISADAFATVHRFERLDLSENPLLGASAVSWGVGQYDVWNGATIHELVLSGTGIEQLPVGAFASVAGLQWIDLSANRLRMPMGVLFDAMPMDLLRLDMSGNLIEDDHANSDDMDEDDVKRSKLRLLELNVYNNSFSAVPSSLRRFRHTLQHLELGGGCLRNVSNVTNTMQELRTLRIHGAQKLEHISDGSLIGLVRLQRLQITDNPSLRSLNVSELLASVSLETLDLRANGLRTIQIAQIDNANNHNETKVQSSSRLRELLLANNPWHCDCDLYRSLTRLVAGSTLATTARLTLLDDSIRNISDISPSHTIVVSHSQLRFESDFNARCSSPHSLSTDFLADLLAVPEEQTPACSNVRNAFKPLPSERWPMLEPPAFLRPRQILLTVLSTLAVVLFGLVIGLTIVYVQRHLRGDTTVFLRSNGIRYIETNRNGADGLVDLRDSTVRYTTVRNSTMMVPLDRQTSVQLAQMQLPPQEIEMSDEIVQCQQHEPDLHKDVL